MHYIIHIKFNCWHKLNIYNIYIKSYTKTHSKLASRREETFGALALLRLLTGILHRLLTGLLLTPVLLILPCSIDITSQCCIIHLCLLKFFLNRSQFVF
jgi:hypothetical protein